MRSKFTRILIAVAALGVTEIAHANGVNISAHYMSTLTMPSNGMFGSNFLGGGLGAEVMAGSHFGFRLGAGYRMRTLGLFTPVSWGLLATTLDVHFYPLHWLYFGVGGFFNYGIAQPVTYRNMDYGFSGTIALAIPFSQRVGLDLGAAYHFNFANIAVSGAAILPHEIVSFVGLRFHFGS